MTRVFSTISEEHDADLVLWKAQGVSLRDMSARLKGRGVKTSRMSVYRRLQAIRRHGAPVQLEQEALQTLSTNLGDLDEVENRLRHLEELAFTGDPKLGLAPNLSLAYRAVTRRGELILSKHRVLQAALNGELGRRGREFDAAVTGDVTGDVTGASP